MASPTIKFKNRIFTRINVFGHIQKPNGGDRVEGLKYHKNLGGSYTAITYNLALAGSCMHNVSVGDGG